MKKVFLIGFTFILLTGLVGCNIFKSSEQAIDEPLIAEKNIVEDMVNKYAYENQEYGFSLAFPEEWGEVKEMIIPFKMYGTEGKGVKLTSKQDSDRYVEISVISIENSKNAGSLPATLIDESNEYVYYFSHSASCYGKPGCEDDKYRIIEEEAIDISETFKLL